MKRNKGIILLLLMAGLTAGVVACKKAGPETDKAVNGYDKAAMLAHYADDLIVPGYKAMQEKVASLQTASDAFVANPTASSQAALKTAYTETHLQYERIVSFQFGPAEAALLDVFLNYSGGLDYSFATAGQLTGFSTDSASIENNIATGSYDLSATTRSSLYSQGFPALNYLYFSPDAIGKFGAGSTNRTKYVNDVLARMKLLVDKVTNDWTTYRAEFISNTKTSNGSPIANIVNQLAYQMDMLKGPRIGWPLGKQSNGIVFADKCEAYYAGISVALAKENLGALKSIYLGTSGDKSISAYLVALNRSALNTDVIAQFDLAMSKLQAIPDPLSATLTSDPATADAAYKEIQKLLTLLKTDVASATSVQITFTDNDGD